MFRILPQLLFVLLWAASSVAQTQTPRQALIEMFSGRDTKSFERHLPKIMQQRLAALDPASHGRFSTSPADYPGMIGRKTNMRWFESGPILLLNQDANSRLEVRVEKEDLVTDRDDLELSLNFGMEGKSFGDPRGTRVLLTMQKEDGIWRLSEVGFTFKMKLDGSFIEAFSKQMKTMMSGSTSVSTLTPTEPVQAPSRTMSERELSASEEAALNRLREMLAAQTKFRTSNPQAGFACDSSALGVNDVDGYRMMIVGCKGDPVSNYKITLTPIGLGVKGKRAFCADESGIVRYSDDGKGVSCLSEKNRIEQTDEVGK